MIRIRCQPGELAQALVVIRGAEHRYVAFARRSRVGDPATLWDGQGGWAEAQITHIDDTSTTFAVRRVGATTPESTGPRLVAMLPLIKGDRMDFALEKLAEVGVSAVLIYAAERAVVKLAEDKRAARQHKFDSQLAAACRQSGQFRVPTCQIVGPLAEIALPSAATCHVFVPGLGPSTWPPPTLGEETYLLFGPEGGFADRELACAEDKGFIRQSLGLAVLRAETAPMLAVAMARHTAGPKP